MDDGNIAAPSVVLAMAVHDPGDPALGWFAEVLNSIAAQDYPSLQALFLVSDGEWTDSVTAAIEATLPTAIVRTVAPGASFGTVVNQVLKVVEGDNGFFLLMHDDVALEPGAVHELVLELYRSNAGVVGPKIVDWDDPSLLQHVGFAMDATGELDPVIEIGERDQEQHDAVADVFVLPSACLLVRADLFRELGGYSNEIEFIGDDVDLCWRAHLTGARVVVVPTARVRHREKLGERAENLRRDRLEARNRVDTVASLTGRLRLPGILLRMFFAALVGLSIGVFTGQSRRPRLTLGALFTLPLRLRRVVRRRKALKVHRRVPDREIKHLQLRGFARWRVFIRHRVAMGHTDFSISGLGDLAGEVQQRRQAEVRAQPRSVTAMWIVLAALLVLGSRGLIANGVSAIGQFQPFGGGPRYLLREHMSGWWPSGFGATAFSPTAILMIAVSGVVALGRMALLHTATVVGLLLIGPVGMWNLSRSFGEYKSRVAATIVYAAVPLPYAAIASGQWNVLTVWAALPVIVYYSQQERNSRNTLKVAIVIATLAAFVPVAAVLLAVGFIVWAAVGSLAGSSSGESANYLRFASIAVAAPLVLLAPWSLRYFSTDAWPLVNNGVSGGAEMGVAQLARFGIGKSVFGSLSWGFYLPLLAAVLIPTGRRFIWSAKAAWWVLVFGAVAVASDAGLLKGWLPDAELMLPFVAFGLAVAAAVAFSVAAADVRRARLGWRQPVAALAVIGVIVGSVPLLVNSFNGRWNQRSVSINQLLAQIPDNSPQGDSRVLYLGDPRVIPAGASALDSTTSAGEVAFAVADDRALAVRNYWSAPSSLATTAVELAVEKLLQGSTLRAGRLLAPLGIRYIVVPIIDGGRSTRTSPIPAPDGLLEKLSSQLDLRRRYQASDLVILENSAWLPVMSQLAEPALGASSGAGDTALEGTEFGDARNSGRPLMRGFSQFSRSRDEVDAGTVHFAITPDSNWRLRVNGETVPPQIAFGSTSAFEVQQAGGATLRYETPTWRRGLELAQMILWGACVLHIANLGRLRRRSRDRGQIHDDSLVVQFVSGENQ